MAAGGDDNKRYVHGLRAVSALLPGVVRPAFRRRSPAGARVLADWESIVGPALAAVTLPRRLVGGTLTIACSGPIAMELSHLADQVIARINQHLGSIAVQRLRLSQEKLPVRTIPAPPVRAEAAAARAVADLPPGPLRDALLSLGSRVLARPP